VAHHGKGWTPGSIFVSGKDAPERGLGVEGRKEIRRYVDCLHLLRHASTTDIKARAGEVVRTYILKRICMFFPGHELGNGYGLACFLAEFEHHLHQPMRLAVRQRLQQDAVHHRKNGRVGPDSEGQRRNGNDGETGTLGQLPRRLSNVQQQNLHGGDYSLG
jgi:hypothetical protein